MHVSCCGVLLAASRIVMTDDMMKPSEVSNTLPAQNGCRNRIGRSHEVVTLQSHLKNDLGAQTLSKHTMTLMLEHSVSRKVKVCVCTRVCVHRARVCARVCVVCVHPRCVLNA